MHINLDVQRELDKLPTDFYGSIELAAQNSVIGVIKVTQTIKVASSGNSRGESNGQPRR